MSDDRRDLCIREAEESVHCVNHITSKCQGCIWFYGVLLYYVFILLWLAGQDNHVEIDIAVCSIDVFLLDDLCDILDISMMLVQIGRDDSLRVGNYRSLDQMALLAFRPSQRFASPCPHQQQ
jgi:hypothetical protein